MKWIWQIIMEGIKIKVQKDTQKVFTKETEPFENKTI